MKTNTIENKLQVGDRFAMGRVTCTITRLSSFSGTEHYGFTYHTDFGLLRAGWMPVYFVDNMTGHIAPDKEPCRYCGDVDCESPSDCPVRRQHIAEDAANRKAGRL